MARESTELLCNLFLLAELTGSFVSTKKRENNYTEEIE